jgi:Glycoside hydrolase 123, catalytic domain
MKYMHLLGLTAMVFLFSCAGGNDLKLTAVDILDLPCPMDSLLNRKLASVSLAAGEDESAGLLLSSADKAAGGKIVVGNLPQNVRVESYLVTPHSRRQRRGGQITLPYFLERSDSAGVERGGKTLVYLTFTADEFAKAGNYDLRVNIGGAQCKLKLTVRPFRLREPSDFLFGAFCGAADVDITPQHLMDLKRRGFDALQFFWGSVSVGLANDDGKLAVDFSTVDRWMEDFKDSGMKGPVVWSMGNDSKSHMENELAGLFDLPILPQKEVNRKMMNFADITNPRLNELLKVLMTAIRDHAREKNWPEIVFIIYDEPTERLMAEHENRYNFLKSFWPQLRIYGVTMNRIEWAEAVKHMVDIYVANGDFAEISELGKREGKPFWLYGSASSRDAASLRHRYAWTAWAHDAGASWFWAYNYGNGDPYDDMDGRLAESTAMMVWPPRQPGGELVASVSWDGMREAADDICYVKTLEWMLEQSQSVSAPEITVELAKIKNSIPEGLTVRVLGGDEHDRVQELKGKKYVAALRDKIAGWIEQLLDEEPDLYREIRLR